MKASGITLAIPTWNNPEQLRQCLNSLAGTDFWGRILVVNNGAPLDRSRLPSYDLLEVVEAGSNLGWVGGINLALSGSRSEHFCMCNDDVVFPHDLEFWSRMQHWLGPKVGGVGPVSNFVSGWQQHKIQGLPPVHTTGYLIGFCALYRRDVIGDGLDPNLPGGDDLDLSIRVRRAGYELVVERSSFLFHHGQQTGKRVHADWDSGGPFGHQMRTTNALIRKHGLREWYDCVVYQPAAMGQPIDTSAGLARGVSELGAYVASKGEIVEGSSTLPELLFLQQTCRSANLVCEIGLNAGLSAWAILSANPRVRLISFDIGEWECTRYAKEYIDSRFPGRHTLVLGDSRRTLPQYLASNPNVRFDLSFVDGGHSCEVATSDLFNLAPVSRVVVVDDVDRAGPMAAWREVLLAGLIKHTRTFYDHSSPVRRSWVVGSGMQ